MISSHWETLAQIKAVRIKAFSGRRRKELWAQSPFVLSLVRYSFRAGLAGSRDWSQSPTEQTFAFSLVSAHNLFVQYKTTHAFSSQKFQTTKFLFPCDSIIPSINLKCLFSCRQSFCWYNNNNRKRAAKTVECFNNLLHAFQLIIAGHKRITIICKSATVERVKAFY